MNKTDLKKLKTTRMIFFDDTTKLLKLLKCIISSKYEFQS